MLATSSASASISRVSAMLRAPFSRSTQLHPSLARSLTSTPRVCYAVPPTQSENGQLNEAQRYLADKSARKATRAANPNSAAARHASLYSQLFPALLRILAYGSTAYFGLHLLWNVLDRDEQAKLMQSHTSGLEATARSLTHKVEAAADKVSWNVSEAESPKKSGKRWYWPF